MIKRAVPILLSLFIIAGILLLCTGQPTLVTYPAPADEPASEDFTVTADGKNVFVYQARVSAVPHNQVWPGHQRSKDQTEIASFAYFDMSAPVTVKVISAKDVRTVDIRPKSYGIQPQTNRNTITFTINEPCNISVEVNGMHNALHLFANETECCNPNPDSPDVRYFGPGSHNAGIIQMKENETIYISGGAVVHGVIEAVDVSNIKVLGRGILDASTIKRSDAKEMISFHGCDNAQISGIILRDPHKWTITPLKCKNVDISNVKLIGLWRYNSDGIDIVNCQDVTIKNCFIRSYDDNIALKGLRRAYRGRRGERQEQYSTENRNLRNIEVSGCVLWGDWGRALEIGAETYADSISNVTFKDCDIIHYVHYAMDVTNGDRAVVHNVTYENIRVEEPTTHNVRIADRDYEPENVGKLIVLNINKNVYSKDTERGKINGITYKDITFTGNTNPKSLLIGLDKQHTVENIIFENVTINGRKINSLEEGNISANEYVKDITFK